MPRLAGKASQSNVFSVNRPVWAGISPAGTLDFTMLVSGMSLPPSEQSIPVRQPARNLAGGVQHCILELAVHGLLVDMGVDGGDVDRRHDPTGTVAHGRGDGADARLEERLAHGIAALAVSGEQRPPRLERRRRLPREAA